MTPGEWHFEQGRDDRFTIRDECDKNTLSNWDGENPEAEGNAEAICTIRNLLPAFLAEVEEKDAELSQARAMREFVENSDILYGASGMTVMAWGNFKSQALALYPKRGE